MLDEALVSIAKHKDKKFIVKTKENTVKVDYNDIVYAELIDRAVRFYLEKGAVLNSVTLRTNFSQAMEELLRDKRFSLCSQNVLVNLEKISEMSSKEISFGDTYKIYIGEKNCRKIRGIWTEYLFDAEI